METGTPPPPWRGTPLPRGRHKLKREDVEGSQRQRLLRAMLELVGESGYPETNVSAVVAAARVDRNAFYAHFEDKLSCFLALCDQEASSLFEQVLEASAPEPTWRRAVAAGAEAYLRWWQERPLFSRAYLVELPAAGPRAMTQRVEASAPFRQMFLGLGARARQEEPGLSPMPELALELLDSGIINLVANEVREGRTEHLAELAPDLATLICALVAGPPAVP
jgi:AcrR family transcriptional regulator